ncbi:MAG: TlpA family protein disulfide reductase [Planctomycetes bacterium]|nr:TlpA family protein disulfide reductase [Planctomycetota bacterium]
MPSERSLVEKFKGRPFAFLGINCDPDIAVAKQAVARHRLPWPNWWCGDDFQIPKRFSVSGLPTTFLLDKSGVVRYVDLHGPEVENTLERLLNEKG